MTQKGKEQSLEKSYLCWMEYQIVHSEISMDERDLVIVAWQILHQPVGQFVHGWDVSVGCCGVLLRPGGHLQRHL